MRAWILRHLMERVFDGISRGDTSLALRLAHRNAHFRFPGRHTFSADYTDRGRIADWFERFAALRPEIEIDDVAVKGPPWDMRAYLRYRDRISDPPRGGEYTNEIISFARIRWLQFVEYVVYLDTQQVAKHFGKNSSATSAARASSQDSSQRG